MISRGLRAKAPGSYFQLCRWHQMCEALTSEPASSPISTATTLSLMKLMGCAHPPSALVSIVHWKHCSCTSKHCNILLAWDTRFLFKAQKSPCESYKKTDWGWLFPLPFQTLQGFAHTQVLNLSYTITLAAKRCLRILEDAGYKPFGRDGGRSLQRGR